MNKVHNETSGIKTGNGDVNAQNITITNNHYGAFSKSNWSFHFIKKNKPAKWTLIVLIASGLAFTAKTYVFKSRIDTKEEFYEFLVRYQQSVSEDRQDAEDYFVDNISTFYDLSDIDPARVNKERRRSDFKKGENNIDVSSIVKRTVGDINYWRYKGAMICWRPSKKQYEKCNVEMEFGLNSDDRITSIRQLGYWDFHLFEQKPGW